MNKTWAEVSCNVPAELADTVSEFLAELSGTGVCVDNRTLDTFSLDDVAPPSAVTIKAYFSEDEGLEDALEQISGFLADNAHLSAGYVPSKPTVSRINEEDWGNNWKQHFRPTRIGRRIIIKPTWEEFPAEPDDIILELDPGMAFGTGTHPTTKLCLECIETIFSRQPVQENLLDVGTGSGILAIAALKLGASQVVAIDIDPDAVEVARENFQLNGVESGAVIGTTPLGQIEGEFGIVVANILAEALVQLREELVARIRTGGHLILSGILTEKEPLVLEGFASMPVTLREVTREGDWSCIAYQREL